MIEVRGLTKRYGAKIAVDDLTFGIEPGKVTGFLGPNGAGKTTTMRCILGLDYADKGTVTVDGKVYPDLAYPMREVGALLDAKAVHGGRSAYNHLLCLAQTNNLPRRRVGEVLELVGLSEVARKRSKGFSLGMSQRLGIAATMLGDPKVLMFDEPVNGLDPEGILWIRNLMKALASEGRTVFVSSHLMSEMEYTADHLIVIGRGKLIADCSMSEFISRSSGASVRVRTPMAEELIKAVTAKGAVAATADDDAVEVRGLTAAEVGDIAFEQAIRLHELATVRASLEEAFMELTASSVEYRAETAGRDHHHRKRCLSDGHRNHTRACGSSALPPAAGQAGLRGAIASEFTKIRSVRSTYWTLGALFIVSVGLGIAISAGTAPTSPTTRATRPGYDATQNSLGVFFELGQLIIAVIGAMVITSEYSTGMIRTSLTAQPRRGVVYAAKAIAFTAVTLVISLVTSFVAFFAGQAMLSGKGVAASLFHTVTIPANANVNCQPDPNGGPSCTATFSGIDVIHPSTVLTAIIGTALFVTLVALIAYGVGSIVRHTAGAIAIVVALLFIVPIIEHLLPHDWRNDIMRFLPDAAKQVVAVTVGGPVAHLWSAWPQLGVTALWAAALVGIGAYLFRKRDA